MVREKARAVGAETWLDDLPDLIASIEADWRISVGRAYRDSTEAFVAEALRDDGTPAECRCDAARAGAAAEIENACAAAQETNLRGEKFT